MLRLVREMIGAVKADGEVCRDEGGAGGGGEVRWWVNVFRGYVWDTGRNEFKSSVIVYFSYWEVCYAGGY